MSSLKLEFMTEEMEYLRPVLMETRTGEETAESIIPDSTPDISEVLFTCGTAFLRGQELMEGRASVSAGVSASVLLQPEGQAEPEVIEAYLPISLTFENSAIHSDLRGASSVFLERLESQLMEAVPLFIILYVGTANDGFFEPLYHNIAGIVMMTCALAVYLAAYIMIEKLITIEV